MAKLIYLIDDEQDILTLVSMNLEKEGYKTRCFEHARPLFAALAVQVPDLLILDLMLPDMDGVDICRQLRNSEDLKKLPIIMLTARVELDDRLKGLDSGADDYITKPFSPQELVARVKAVLRRFDWEVASNVLVIEHNLKIDLNCFEVYISGKRIDLTRTEFKILQLLTKRPGWVYNRSQILDYLWGNDKIVVDRTIDVHVKHLREKIGDYGKYIRNVRGVGYKFDLEDRNSTELDNQPEN